MSDDVISEVQYLLTANNRQTEHCIQCPNWRYCNPANPRIPLHDEDNVCKNKRMFLAPQRAYRHRSQTTHSSKILLAHEFESYSRRHCANAFRLPWPLRFRWFFALAVASSIKTTADPYDTSKSLLSAHGTYWILPTFNILSTLDFITFNIPSWPLDLFFSHLLLLSRTMTSCTTWRELLLVVSVVPSPTLLWLPWM